MSLPRQSQSPRPSAFRGSSGARAALATSLLGLAACRASRSDAPAPEDPQAVLAESPLGARLAVLQAEIAAEEDDLAERRIAELRAWGLDAREEEYVRAAERVILGRRLVRTLELALESDPVPGGPPGRYRLFLRASSHAESPLRLSLPPADLKRRRSTMDSHGVEGIEYESRISAALSDLSLEPGVERRLELGAYELALGGALVARERWRLEPRSGEIECDGETYPAARVRVKECERERLAPSLAREPVEPAALAARLAADPAPEPREFLELALRVPVLARDAALAALTPEVQRLAREAPERMQAAEPALRWLSGRRDLGTDAVAWGRYLEARARAPEVEAQPLPGGLDLPDRAASVRRFR